MCLSHHSEQSCLINTTNGAFYVIKKNQNGKSSIRCSYWLFKSRLRNEELNLQLAQHHSPCVLFVNKKIFQKGRRKILWLEVVVEFKPVWWSSWYFHSPPVPGSHTSHIGKFDLWPGLTLVLRMIKWFTVYL